MVRIAGARKGGPGGAHIARERVAIIAHPRQEADPVRMREHERQLHAVHAAQPAAAQRRSPVEAIQVDRRATLCVLRFGDRRRRPRAGPIRRRRSRQRGPRRSARRDASGRVRRGSSHRHRSSARAAAGGHAAPRRAPAASASTDRPGCRTGCLRTRSIPSGSAPSPRAATAGLNGSAGSVTPSTTGTKRSDRSGPLLSALMTRSAGIARRRAACAGGRPGGEAGAPQPRWRGRAAAR